VRTADCALQRQQLFFEFVVLILHQQATATPNTTLNHGTFLHSTLNTNCLIAIKDAPQHPHANMLNIHIHDVN